MVKMLDDSNFDLEIGKMIFKDGNVMKTMVGLTSKELIISKLNRYLG